MLGAVARVSAAGVASGRLSAPVLGLGLKAAVGRAAPAPGWALRSLCSGHGSDSDSDSGVDDTPLMHAPGKIVRNISDEMSRDKDLADLLEYNKEWAARMEADDPSYFKELASGQAPKYLWIGCSDSRVPANQILGLGPGEVFVHRNVGGLCVNTDLNVLSVLQFAVEVLKVQHIIVCGHYDCGAVKAALQPKDLGLIDNWLRNIRDVARLHHDRIFAEKPEDRVNRLIEYNVLEQVVNVFKTGVVQRARLASFKEGNKPWAVPRVHGMVFNPADGLVKPIDADFRFFLRKYKGLYKVADLEDA